jgi:H+/Cl- antiporter ClcA
LPITGPIAALCLLLALAVKMSRRVDDDVNAFRLATVFLVLGATLYYFPQVFAVEAASQEHLATIAQAFTSNTNPEVALWIMWASLAGVILVAGWIFFRAMASAGRTMTTRGRAPVTKTTPDSTAVAD